jgi:TIR domain
MADPINMFIIYAREDKDIKNRIVSYLNPFRTPFNLIIWHDDNIDPGQLWQKKIKDNLEQTDLFLLLVSIDFMNSDFILKVECRYAIDMHKANKSVVIPVIIKPCPWDIDLDLGGYAFNLSELQVLPYEAKPIADWNVPDNAYNNIASGIKKFLKDIVESRKRVQSEIEKSQNQEIEDRLSKENAARKKKEEEEKRIEAEYQYRLSAANEKYNSGYFEEALDLFTKLSADRPEANDIRDKINQCKEKISREEYDWNEASTSGDRGMVREFQKKYPVSKYLIEADSLIRKLQPVKKTGTLFFAILKKYRLIISVVLFITVLLIVVIMKFSGTESPSLQHTEYPSDLEQNEWRTATQKNDVESYRLYQYRFPNGKYYKDAQRKIDSFNEKFENN